jgi:RNA polymerase sigma-70 factor, ECF subfamily
MAAEATADDAELERLLAACARRDSRALRALYDRTAPHLLACLMRILRQRALAEDVLQEVFVNIWQRATQYEPQRGRPRAWLFSIARHRAIDALRRERPDGELGVDIVERLPDPSADDATESITGSRVTAALTRCLDLLNVDQRRGIQLAFVDGLSHAEIATMTGEPLGTIKSWIRRGLLSLRQCLER